MKNNWIKILVAGLVVAAIGLYSPVQCMEKTLPAKSKTGRITSRKVTKPDTESKNTKNIKTTPAKLKKNTKKENKEKPVVKAKKSLPMLLDLGSSTCIPCKMMVPVLNQLTKEYKGKLKVKFIDVGKDEASARKYRIQTIPTQIFFNAKGKEVSRHIGYIPKEDILKTFSAKNIDLK